MIWIKRSFGLLACLLGVAGIVVCLVACVAIWVTRSHVNDTLTGVFHRVDSALVRVDQRCEETILHVQDTQESATQMRREVRLRVAKAAGAKVSGAADIDGLRQQLAAKVQRAKDWTEFIRSTMEMAEQLLEIVDSAAMVDRRSQNREELFATIQAGYEEIERASELLEEMQEHVAEIRDGTNVQQNSGRVQLILDRLDKALTKLRQHIQQFQSGIQVTQVDTANLLVRIYGLVLLAAVILTVLFAWLGIAQFSLAIHGWKLLRKPT